MPASATDKDIRLRLARCQRKIDTLRQTARDLRRRLAASQSQFLVILTELPHPILIHRNDTIVFINPAALQALGSTGTLVGQSLKAWVSADTHRTMAALAPDLMAGHRPPQRRRGMFQRRDGTVIKVEWIASVVAFDDRPALLMVFADITENLRMAEELAQSEERYRSLVENLPLPVFVHRQGRFLYLNPAAVALHGATEAAQLLGRSLVYFVHPDDRDRFRSRLSRLDTDKADPMMSNLRLIRLDGQAIEVEVSAISIRYEASPARLVILRDITGRRRMENNLRTSQEVLAQQSLRLEETNRALKLMLDHRQIEKRAVEENFMAGMKKFVLPYLDKVAAGNLTPEVRTYLDILRSNLDDLLSPMRHQRFVRYADLTPNEIQIAELIRQGRSSKEIAIQLNVSVSAIAFHRNNIRRKFGLLKKGTNLRAYLDSLGA